VEISSRNFNEKERYLEINSKRFNFINPLPISNIATYFFDSQPLLLEENHSKIEVITAKIPKIYIKIDKSLLLILIYLHKKNKK
jgi:hypothetical protein